jgi:hypothetical protein
MTYLFVYRKVFNILMEIRAIFKTQNIVLHITLYRYAELCLDILHFTTCGNEQTLYFIVEFLFESRLTGFILRLRKTISVAVIKRCCVVSTLWTTK